MSISALVAKHLREVCVGPNWTAVNLKERLEGVTWQQATTRVRGFNSIATLVYHSGWYMGEAQKVLTGGHLDTSDKESFDHPPINSEEDWAALREKTWKDVEELATAIEQLPDSQLLEDFDDGKYGNHYRNLVGIIEHFHYHLGQISLIKKLL